MNPDELIRTDEVCTRYKIERRFISSLQESGLVEIVSIEEQEYIPQDKMGEFERMMRLHYDLNINIEGLEAIQHLLEQVKRLQRINRELKNRLELYE